MPGSLEGWVKGQEDIGVDICESSKKTRGQMIRIKSLVKNNTEDFPPLGKSDKVLLEHRMKHRIRTRVVYFKNF